MSPGYDLCPSVSSVVPGFTLARTNASIEAAELSGMAARRMRPDRVSRYFARFRLGLAWFVPRSRVPGDDEQRGIARQRSDDVLGDPVGDELLLGVAAHVGE